MTEAATHAMACGSGLPAANAHSRNLRKGRISEPGRIYLVTAATRGRRPYFGDLYLGRLVVKTMMHLDRSERTRTWAFVVMPDHLHWLCSLEDGAALPRVMHALKGYSGLLVNRNTGRTGPVWQAGYHDHALRTEEDLADVAHYVVANPVRAGLVQRVGDYPLWDATRI